MGTQYISTNKTYRRLYNEPLDPTSVFKTQEELDAYLLDPTCYNNQIIGFNDKVYIIIEINGVKKIKEVGAIDQEILDEMLSNINENKSNIDNVILNTEEIKDSINLLSTNLSKKVVFAKDFGILGQGEDYTEGMTLLQNYLDNNRVDEVIFEPNGIIYTDVNLKVKNCKLNGMGTTIMPIEQSWLFHNQKALIVLDDNSECFAFKFNGNYLNNWYEQDGKIFYSGASSTTALVVSIGCTGTWIIGDHCSCHHNEYKDLQWTCIDVNGKSKECGRSKDIDIYSNIFYNSGEDHVAIHSVEDVRVHNNYSYDASNHAIHPYSFVKNVRIYDNYISIITDNIIEWNEGYIKNSQRTAFILDHPQYPQSEVYNVIIENNIVVGNFKAGVELTGFADCYYINNNEFIGDGTNIGIRYKTITLRDSMIERNKFRNLSKCFSINTLSMLALPTYDTRVEGSVLIQNNSYIDSTIAYEIFATADVSGIESFTMTTRNNDFYNVEKPTNIHTMLTNFHLEIFDVKDYSKATFNGNTLYDRENSIRTLEKDNINILPLNVNLKDVNNNILGFTTRSKVNTGVNTILEADENNNLVINTSEGNIISYTYAYISYLSNPFIAYDKITMNAKFTCESDTHFYLIIQSLDEENNITNRVTVIDQEIVAGEVYDKWNIFNLSRYNFNDETKEIRIMLQFGNSSSYNAVTNFKLLGLSIVEGLMYKIPPINKSYTLQDMTYYLEPRTYYASAPPSSGAYKVGTKIINSNPSEGTYSGWICSKSGNPSTWLGYGLINKTENILPYNFKIKNTQNEIVGIEVRSKVNTGVTTSVSCNDDGNLVINTDGDMTSYTYANLTYTINPLINADYSYVRFKYKCDTPIKFSVILQALNFDGSINKQLLLIENTLEENKEYILTKGFNLSKYNLNSPECMFRIQFKFGDSNNLTQVTNFVLMSLDFTTSPINDESLVYNKSYTLSELYKFTAPPTLYSNKIPTTGNYLKGTRIINVSPVSGGYSGWICITSGSPGVWRGFGLIE